MKNILYIIPAILLLSACGEQAPATGEEPQTAATTAPLPEVPAPKNFADLFTQADAEKILGEPAHLKDSSTTMNGDTLMYQCAYEANATDKKSGKTGTIYFMMEGYAQAEGAHNQYTFFKVANEKNGGLTDMQGMGDEAYFHTDNTNFYFILARKGKHMLRMKVNKITGTTSVDEFTLISKRIMEEV